MKLYLQLLLLTLFVTSVNAQKKPLVEVLGVVIDKETNQPLEYATLVFQNQRNPDKISGGITDSKGKFKIDVMPGYYNINVEFVSYETYKMVNKVIRTDTNLGRIEIAYAADQLKAVEIVQEKTTVEVKLDKKIYNIGKDITAAGGNVSDALNNVPSVDVDVDGTVTLRGNENVRILINGKPSAMVSASSTDILSQLPADAVERVEVITSPSARYDAEGTAGILNIVLRKEKTLGFNGSLNFTLGYPAYGKASANLNFRTRKINLFTNIGNFYRTPPGNTTFINTYTNGDFTSIREDRDISREDTGYNANVGLEYFINEKSSITTSFFTRLADEFDLTENNSSRFVGEDLNSIVFVEEATSEDDTSIQASVNYVHNFNFEGHKLTADFQYSYDDEHITSDIQDIELLNNPGLVDREVVYETETQNEFLIQADYVLPKGDSQLEFGYRGKFEEEVNDYELQEFDLDTEVFSINEELTNTFTYNENINAVYGQYGNKFGNFSFLAGLRLEYTQLKGKTVSDFDIEIIEALLGDEIELNFEKDYLELFPTLNLIYELREDESLTLGYNRRINRPRGFFINPFPSRSSDANIFQGNPGILPVFSGTYEVGYLKKSET